MVEVIPQKVREVWKEWNLRVFVLLSLTLQIILVILGSSRKYIPKPWIRIAVWSAYLMADSIAILGIGILSNDLAEMYDNKKSINEKVELTAFWGPFLLLHLGGPDTITAYSLEDNNLWLRHFLGLAIQTGGTIYIFLMSWTGSHLSILFIMMIVAGFIKYGERVWVLRQASYEQLRDSPSDPAPNYSKLMEEVHLKMAEGYEVKRDEVIEVKGAVDLSLVGNSSNHDAEILFKASGLLDRFKGLFVDLLLRVSDRDTSRFIITNMSCEDAFKTIEIELGLMYDLIYTKAAILSTRRGCACRIISFSLTFSALVVFSLVENHRYRKVDLAITYTLLGAAVLLEIYAILRQLSSDRTIVWLCKHDKFSFILPAITSLRCFKRKRWSHSMAQFSLISFSDNQTPKIFSRTMKLIDQKLEKQHFVTYEKISQDLKESIFEHLKEKFDEESRGDADLKDLCTYRGDSVLKKFNCFDSLGWSTNLEFDQSILIWHIATELCRYEDIKAKDQDEVKAKAQAQGEGEVEAQGEGEGEIEAQAQAQGEGEGERFSEMCKHISQYMLHLLVMYPFMLPTRIGQIMFRDTSVEAMNLLKRGTNTSQFIDLLNWAVNIIQIGNGMPDTSKACDKLLEEKLQLPVANTEGDRRNSVLFDACKLALQLQKIRDKKKKWKMVSEVWLEMLTYAANKCNGNSHAQQLRRGGELLTHVWFLMAHLGISEQFQMLEGQVTAKIIVR